MAERKTLPIPLCHVDRSPFAGARPSARLHGGSSPPWLLSSRLRDGPAPLYALLGMTHLGFPLTVSISLEKPIRINVVVTGPLPVNVESALPPLAQPRAPA